MYVGTHAWACVCIWGHKYTYYTHMYMPICIHVCRQACTVIYMCMYVHKCTLKTYIYKYV